MNLRLSKSALGFLVFTVAGIAAAVLTKPDRPDVPASELDSAGITQSETTDASTVAPTSKQSEKLVPFQRFLTIPADRRQVRADLRPIEDNWNIAYAPLLLESFQFMDSRSRSRDLQNETKQQFGSDRDSLDQWRHWLLKQNFKPHPDLVKFESKLYSRLDPRFAEYFPDADGATIRLDEIRWGEVQRDGIPPLNKPQMVSAAQAKYLGDSDVVFGIGKTQGTGT